MNDILKDLKLNIKENTVLITATSGGPDSMTLLNLLLKIKETKKINIICAHVNHKLRKESDDEAIMVKNYCQKHNITFEYMTIENYQGNTENYARTQRYKFFEKLIKKYQATYLLTAHHGDDLTETIIMRLIRGSSLKGYSGFNKITQKENYQIYRPLITKTKEEILNYAKKNDIPFAIDQTNESDTFTRNRIRKYILPYLKKENKNVHLKFLNFSNTLNESENYFQDLLTNIIPNLYQNNTLDLYKFKNQKTLIQKKIIYYILKDIYKEKITLINDKHVNSILYIINSQKPNQIIFLPQNKVLKKEYNKVYIKENKENEEYDYILKNNLTLPNNHIIEIINDINNNSNYVTKISSKEITLPLHVRTRKTGDKLVLKGLNKTKKVKDIFIDEKIPLNQRNIWPIITDNNGEIIWLPGLKKTKFDKSNTENYDIIIRYR